MNDDTSSPDDVMGTIPAWIAPTLEKFGVTKIAFNFSGGGDSGGMDDYTFYDEGNTILSSQEIEESLGALKIRKTDGMTVTAWDLLIDSANEDSEKVGNYWDNEGGSAYLEYEVADGVINQTVAEINENEDDFEYIVDDFEDDFEGDENEAEPYPWEVWN